MTDIGTPTPLPSRPVSDAMTFTVRDCRATVAAYTSFLPARAHIPEPDSSETVAADPAIIDTESHPLYRDGVKHRPSCSCGECSQRIAEYEEAMTCSVCAQYGDGCNCDYVRLSRLSRWQEQR